MRKGWKSGGVEDLRCRTNQLRNSLKATGKLERNNTRTATSDRNSRIRIGADYQNSFNRLAKRQHVALILEQYNALSCRIQCSRIVLSVDVCDRSILLIAVQPAIRRRDGQDAPNLLVDRCL